jgi:hypothetical protein
MATEKAVPISDEGGTVKIPPPVDGGTEYLESLGRWVDNLMGDARERRAAGRRLEPITMSDDDAPEDPPPAEIPSSVPGGTEVITRGGKPNTKIRIPDR